jgi:hypothetical protein
MVGAELRGRLFQSATPLSPRKLRLLASACCRRAWRLLVSERSRRAVALAERRADGQVDCSRLESAHLEASRAADQQPQGSARQAAARLAALAADPFILRPGRLERLAAALDRLAAFGEGRGTFNEPFRALLGDVFGPVGQPLRLRPEWLTPTVDALAQRVREGRDELAMLVLADALEEAGCTDDAVLAHCRSSEVHVRGCWAVDMALGLG